MTLVANNETDVVLPNGTPAQLQVVARNGLGEIFYTVDGTAPAVAGDDCHIVPAAVGCWDVVEVNPGATVKLISAAAATLTLELL